MNPIVMIIINLLIAFLKELFQRWLDNKFPASPHALMAAKQDYMKRVKWRFWLGPNRMQLAEKAFSQAHLKYESAPIQYSENTTAEDFAKSLTSGISL